MRVYETATWYRSSARDVQAPRDSARDRVDLEVTGHDRRVAEEPAEERALDFEDGRVERDRCSATAEEAVLDNERAGGQLEMRAIPTRDRDDDQQRREREQRGTRECGRLPRREEARRSGRPEEQRTEERTEKNDPVSVCLNHQAWFSFAQGIPRQMEGTGTARRAAIATIVVISIVVVALALWELRLLIALLFLGFVIASAMRPSVEWLHRRARVPRSVGVVLHYVLFFGAVGLFLYLVVPVAITQVHHAIGTVPTSQEQLHHAATHSHGLRHAILTEIDKRLAQLPSGASLLHPAIDATRTAFEVLVAILLVFAVGAYWIFERDNAIALVQSLVPRHHRRVTRDTWVLIDMKLGAFMRGEFLLVVIVASLLSFAFWLDGEPYWLLVAAFAGIVELVPIVGPMAAGVLAVGVGLTAGWGVAIGAGIAVLILRQLEDYVIAPRVMGHAVGLSPLFVLVSVIAIGYLLGWLWVLIAIPVAAIVSTLIDVVIHDRDPAKEEAPAVLFPAQRSER